MHKRQICWFHGSFNDAFQVHGSLSIEVDKENDHVLLALWSRIDYNDYDDVGLMEQYLYILLIPSIHLVGLKTIMTKSLAA
jgi:hypothetical protein